ncbi:MAG: hypothetical protein J1E02_06740, partial [Coprobacter sp.]|nr:hypothetical protein [Coprobacter sp.]
SHTIGPKFDTDNGTWTRFEVSRNSLLATADRYRSDALYKEMSHIPGFAAGLDRTALEKKLNAQQKSFYQKLSRQIIDHFQSEEPTPENIARLNQVYVQFADENTSEISELVRFLRNYKEQ